MATPTNCCCRVFRESGIDWFHPPRKYFVDKKEASAGIFADLLADSDGLIKNISDDLRALDKLIVKPNAVNGELSEDDICSHFRYCVI